MLDQRDVTACLVTRGDQPEMVSRIKESLIFDKVVVWDNSVDEDWKCAGRYQAAGLSDTQHVYWQDDDVLVPQDTQRELLRQYEWPITACWGHGAEPAGYDDLPLVCGGAIADREAAFEAIARYATKWPLDEAFMYEADFVVGVLYPRFKHVHLPFDIQYEVAQHPSRLVNQPWQQDLKFGITNRARRIRDDDEVREYANWYAGSHA